MTQVRNRTARRGATVAWPVSSASCATSGAATRASVARRAPCRCARTAASTATAATSSAATPATASQVRDAQPLFAILSKTHEKRVEQNLGWRPLVFCMIRTKSVGSDCVGLVVGLGGNEDVVCSQCLQPISTCPSRPPVAPSSATSTALPASRKMNTDATCAGALSRRDILQFYVRDIERCTKDKYSLFGSRLCSNRDLNSEYKSFGQSSISILLYGGCFCRDLPQNSRQKTASVQ